MHAINQTLQGKPCLVPLFHWLKTAPQPEWFVSVTIASIPDHSLTAAEKTLRPSSENKWNLHKVFAIRGSQPGPTKWRVLTWNKCLFVVRIPALRPSFRVIAKLSREIRPALASRHEASRRGTEPTATSTQPGVAAIKKPYLRPEAGRLNYEHRTLMLVGRAWGGDAGVPELLEVIPMQGTSALHRRPTARARRPRLARGRTCDVLSGSARCPGTCERSARWRGIARPRCLPFPRFGDSQSVPTETLQPQVPGDYALAETPVEVACDDAVVCAVLVWANSGRSCCKVV
jgi:hypothetical protein